MNKRYDVTTTTSRPYHSNVNKYGLRYPAGVSFAEDLHVDTADTRLPKDVYISRERLRQEIDSVWKKTWQYVCREEEVQKPGDIYVFDFAGQSFLVVRQPDGSLKAFHNVCLHRGNRLLDAPCSVGAITCPFHRWSWRLDGELRAIPDAHTYCEIHKEEYGLRQAHCETWAGFVFINQDPNSVESLANFLGPVPAQLAPFHIEDFTIVHNSIMPLAANWKTTVEAFIEVCHVQGVHPELLYAQDDLNSPFEILSEKYGHSRQIAVFGVPSQRIKSYTNARVVAEYAHCAGVLVGRNLDTANLRFLDDTDRVGPEAAAESSGQRVFRHAREFLLEATRNELAKRGLDPTDFTDDQLVDDYHYFIFPGMVVNVAAGGSLVIRVMPMKDDPDRCYIQTTVLQKLPEALRKEIAPVLLTRFSEEEGMKQYPLVLRQDYSNIPRTQIGLHSDGIETLTVSKQEVRIIELHKTLRRMIDGAQRG